MHLVCLDLEGVLIPEIWIAFAEATNTPGLKRTTRDEPDYDKLMRYRIDTLNRRGFSLPDIQKIIVQLDPLPGAEAFVNWLQSRTRLIILSDTFTQFAGPLMAKLGYPTLFCNELIVDPSGQIRDYRLRQRDQKRASVNALRGLNFTVVAAGDSYNDLSMLKAANHGILFRPPACLPAEYPQYPTVHDHDQLQACIAEQLSLVEAAE